MARQITWIRKPGGSYNPGTHITEVGGTNWSRSVEDAVKDIKADEHAYYVATGAGTAWVSYGVRNGHYYLHTVPDGTALDNLLSLTNLDG
jgi:hypothetical protein